MHGTFIHVKLKLPLKISDQIHFLPEKTDMFTPELTYSFNNYTEVSTTTRTKCLSTANIDSVLRLFVQTGVS